MDLTEFLAKLKETNGAMSVSEGVVWFDDGTSFDLNGASGAGSAIAPEGDADNTSDYEVVVRISVTANSSEEAAKLALDDLRDTKVGPWTMEVSNCLGEKTVTVGTPDQPGPVCKKCGSPMHGDYCSDDTCAYSEWPQHVPVLELQSEPAAALRERYGVVCRIRIHAEVHSDDHRVSAQFDAAPWFAQASDDEIVQLKEAEWERDEIADEVATYFIGSNNDVDLVFDYLGILPDSVACGFECCVEEEPAMEWLKRHRPNLWLRFMNDNLPMDDVAEWVGMHYRANFSAEPVDRKVDWVSRYQESHR